MKELIDWIFIVISMPWVLMIVPFVGNNKDPMWKVVWLFVLVQIIGAIGHQVLRGLG